MDPYLELERKLRPLAEPLPAPRPGDWLAEHHEPGQTLAEYVHAQPVRRSDKLNTIHLCFIGDLNQAQRRVLDLTRESSRSRRVAATQRHARADPGRREHFSARRLQEGDSGTP